MQGEEHLGLEVVVEEIRSEIHPAAGTEPFVHRAKGFHREESALTVPALRPGIGEIDVKRVDGAGRKIVEERLRGDVQKLHVLETPFLRLLPCAAATLGLDVDADEERIGTAFRVRHEEVTIAAPDLDLAAAGPCPSCQKILHRRQPLHRALCRRR